MSLLKLIMSWCDLKRNNICLGTRASNTKGVDSMLRDDGCSCTEEW